MRNTKRAAASRLPRPPLPRTAVADDDEPRVRQLRQALALPSGVEHLPGLGPGPLLLPPTQQRPPLARRREQAAPAPVVVPLLVRERLGVLQTGNGGAQGGA